MTKQTPKHKTREQWLNAAAVQLNRLIKPHHTPAETVRVSVGFPFRSGGRGNKAIGQCWSPDAAEDKVSQIFIHPNQNEPTRVLDILLHELIHAAVGTECGHRGDFRRVALAVGLEGKMTATVAGADLGLKLCDIYDKLGPYPHGRLDPAMSPRKKEATRLIKVDCGCGYTIRVTQKWIDVGLPTCPCGEEMEVAQ